MLKEKKKRDRRTKQIILKTEAPGAARLAVASFDMERLAWFGLRFEFWRRDPKRKADFEGMDAAELAEQKRLQTMFWMAKDWPVKRLDHLDDKLTLEIDFSKVNSPKALKEQVTNLIEVCWFAYARKTGHKTLKSQKDYDLILKVGDMVKSNPGLDIKDHFRKIGEELFPDGDQPSREAKKRYADYEKLINGGWQPLRFP
jgi:hypothetical protein